MIRDDERKLIIIKKTIQKQLPSFSGIIVDAESGERLPYATVAWWIDDRKFGVAANQNGSFTISNPISNTLMEFSYLGYTTQAVPSDLLANSDDLTIRLSPMGFSSTGVIVVDSRLNLYSDSLSTSWLSLPSRNIAGESNAIRNMEVFPAVMQNVGTSTGLVVRGSNPDALQVLLDGNMIFTQNHLFGLLDIFNSDALQTMAFHYYASPAEYLGLPGGTLALHTRNGSQVNHRGAVRLSNLAAQATVEGPLAKGKGSYLISGRHSYLNSLNLFDNQALISFGLNVDRPHSDLPESVVLSDERLLQARSAEADFHDVHAKLTFETPRNGKLWASMYQGSDFAIEEAQRYFRVDNQGGFRDQFQLQDIATSNNWTNLSLGVGFQQMLSPKVQFSIQSGSSIFESAFSKSDFSYAGFSRPDPAGTSGAPQIGAFSNETRVEEFHIKLHSYWFGSNTFTLSGGAEFLNFSSQYEEESLLRDGRDEFVYDPVQLDFFIESDWKPASGLTMNSGLRFHNYSLGNYSRLSPRINLDYQIPNTSAAFFASAARLYQFLHRFSVDQQTMADVWVMTDEDEGPTEMDELNIGFRTAVWRGAALRLEGYYKHTRNLRLHQIPNVFLITSSNLNARFSGNQSFSRGVELSFTQIVRRHRFGLSYTLSNTELQNDLYLNGDRYPAEWDRRHQLVLRQRSNLNSWLQIWATGTWASGSPNYLSYARQNGPTGNADIFANEPFRLDNYFRIDAGLTMSSNEENRGLEFELSFFNLLNRNNVWYRQFVSTFVDERPIVPRLESFVVDFYDLGFRPSLSLRLSF